MIEQPVIKNLSQLYPAEGIIEQKKRYSSLLATFQTKFGIEPTAFFSAPGRTEIIGNHTDHNSGKVVAAAVNLDTIAAVGANNSNKVVIWSEGYASKIEVDLSVLKVQKDEQGSSAALVRGIAYKFKQEGEQVSGFNAVVASSVMVGSGLSSSAAFEVLIATIFNGLFNQNSVSMEKIARYGQFAENSYFGKPCGLMDQMASAVGGLIAIDFESQNVKKQQFNLSKNGLALLVIDTGGSHDDLTEAYAAIPTEMKTIASHFKKAHLRAVDEADFYSCVELLSEKHGHRAVLRAMHFFAENQRVDALSEALENEDIEKFLQLVQASGNSSYKWLQNIYLADLPSSQIMSLTLALSEKSLAGNGVCRVHGGGFAGTVQVFLKQEILAQFITEMKNRMPQYTIYNLHIRPVGACQVSLEAIL